jgi:molecular chaperone DnaK
LKNDAYNVHETTQKQLDEFRSKLPAEEIENIEKALNELNEWKDKDLQVADIDNVKNAINNARNAAMKIGQAMYNQQSGQSESQSQENSEENKDKKE